MKLEHYLLDKLAKHIKIIVFSKLNPKKYRLLFFGSRVVGTHNERSDIDLGIEGATKINLEYLPV